MSASDFKVITLVPMSDATVQSTDVAETDYPEWDSGTTYAAGDFVIRVSTHRIYVSQQATNLAKTPEDEAAWWEDVGPTNAWAMFDNSTTTVTNAGADSQTTVLTPGIIDSVYVVAQTADSVSVTVKNTPGGTVVYSKTQTLAGATIPAWVGVFSDPTFNKGEALFSGIPAYAGCEVTVVISGALVVEIDTLAVGRTDVLGKTLDSPSPRFKSYDRIDTDPDFPEVRTYVAKGYSKGMRARVLIDNDKLAKVYQIGIGARSRASVWIGSDSDRMEPLRMLGYLFEFSPEVKHVNHTPCTVDIEGM